MAMALVPDPKSGFTQVVGIGGIGTGVVFQLEGAHTLGREESRMGTLLAGRDYCKLHIVEHYIATLMGAKAADAPFRVVAVGVVGNDAAGGQLLDEMSAAGIDTEWVRKDAERGTLFSTCFVYPDGSGGNITASNSAAASLNAGDLRRAEEGMRTAAGRGIALCLPEVPLEVRHEFLKLATTCGNYRAASFTRSEIRPAQALGLFSMIDLLALNQEEASVLTGYGYTADDTEGFLSRCSAALTRQGPAMRIVISAGADGAYGFENGTWNFCRAPQVPVVSTGGAGDALLAGVLCGLVAGLPFTSPGTALNIKSALGLGVLLASFSVTSPDAIHFQADLKGLEEFASSGKIFFGGSVGAGSKQSSIPRR